MTCIDVVKSAAITLCDEGGKCLGRLRHPQKIKKTFFGPFRIVFEPFWIVFRAVLAHFRAVLHDFHTVFFCFFNAAPLRRRCSAIVASARRRRGAAASARRNLPRIYPPSSRTVNGQAARSSHFTGYSLAEGSLVNHERYGVSEN